MLVHCHHRRRCHYHRATTASTATTMVNLTVVNCQRKRQQQQHHKLTNGSTNVKMFTSPDDLGFFNLSTVLESFFSAPGQICPPFFVRYIFWREYEGRSALQVEGISALTNTPAVRRLEERFSAVLERFLEPIHALHVHCKN
jgi:hypothetical protein